MDNSDFLLIPKIFKNQNFHFVHTIYDKLWRKLLFTFTVLLENYDLISSCSWVNLNFCSRKSVQIDFLIRMCFYNSNWNELKFYLWLLFKIQRAEKFPITFMWNKKQRVSCKLLWIGKQFSGGSKFFRWKLLFLIFETTKLFAKCWFFPHIQKYSIPWRKGPYYILAVESFWLLKSMVW